MDYSMVAPKTCVLKLNVCCSGCERKVKKLLLNIHGVHSVSIDKEDGKVTVSGTVDPHTLKTTLEKAGKKPEIVYPNQSQQSNENNQDMQIVPSKPVLLQGQGINDPHMVAQLQQLSQISGLKHVELTHSKTIKLTFKGEKDELGQETDTHKIVVDGGAAAAPCCGGHAVPHGYHDGAACGGHHGLPRVCGTHNRGGGYWMPPPPCGCIPPPPPPPPWPSWTAPSGPQYVPNYDPTAPPEPVGYPYYHGPSGDDNLNRCMLM